MATPQFDLTKFYRVRSTGAELAQMFATLEKLDSHVTAERAIKKRRLLIGFAALFVALVITFQMHDGVFGNALTLSIFGALFVVETILLRIVLSASSNAGTRVQAGFFTLFSGFILFATGSMLFEDTEGIVSLRHPLYAACVVGVGTLTVVLALYWGSGARWSKLAPQQFELGYVKDILSALFNDLPKRTRGDVIFNPFRGEWSRVTIPAPKRSGYTFTATADIILQLRLPLDDQRELKLSVTEQELTKVKNYKGKYRGTKRRVLVRYDLTLPEASTVSQAALVKMLPEGCRVVVGEHKLTVLQLKKTATFDRELSADHLVPSKVVLDTISAMSALLSTIHGVAIVQRVFVLPVERTRFDRQR